MAKNLMPEILKMLGVEYGEKFKLRENGEEDFRDGVFCFIEDLGFRKLTLDDKAWSANEMLEELLTGYYEIVKLPWEPKEGEIYYYPAVYSREIHSVKWCGITADYTLKALVMVYRTQEEAEAHFAEDYEKLTGKKLRVKHGRGQEKAD